MLKRAHKGTFHRLSAKHLQRYVSEFAGRHNIRDLDTIDQMEDVVAGPTGRRAALPGPHRPQRPVEGGGLAEGPFCPKGGAPQGGAQAPPPVTALPRNRSEFSAFSQNPMWYNVV